ncbi:alpha/beta hydrolase [Nocardia sp. NPDC050710]|uniref:alpha/beta hydrolase n=1 Tax=Nocardia sp. NPDC050710 TaxID=3157220 RepID=UPI0033E1A05F
MDRLAARADAYDNLPAEDRHRAKVGGIADLRHHLRQRAEELRHAIGGHIFGGLFTNEDAELDLVTTKLADLVEIEKLVDTNPEGYLLHLDTTGTRTKAVFAVGDPDTADHIAVITPGLNTTVGAWLGTLIREVTGLRDEAHRALRHAGRTDTVATIAWLGYEPPCLTGGLDDLVCGGMDALFDIEARAGAPDLADFYSALARNSTRAVPHLVALGHSYGSLTTSLALQHNPVHPVDDAIFYGSPGLYAADATDLALPPGRAYLAEADRDWVADTGWFGGDPADGDFTALTTHAGIGYDGAPRRTVTGHSEYARAGTVTAHNFAMLIAGLPDLLIR